MSYQNFNMTNSEETQLNSGIINSIILQNQINLFLSSNRTLTKEQLDTIKQTEENYQRRVQQIFGKENVKKFCFQTLLQNYNYDKVEIYYFALINDDISDFSTIKQLQTQTYRKQLNNIGFQEIKNTIYPEYQLIQDQNKNIIKHRLFLILKSNSIQYLEKQMRQQDSNNIQHQIYRHFINTCKFYNIVYDKLEYLHLNTISDFIFIIKAILLQNQKTFINDLQILLLANSISEQITGAVQSGPKLVEVLLKRLIYDIVEKLDVSSNMQYTYEIKDQNDEKVQQTESFNINIMDILTPAEKINIYQYFKYIKNKILCKMTHYLDNPLYTQMLGKILFTTLINRYKYLKLNQFEYKIVFASKTAISHSIQELYIILNKLFDYLDIKLQNYHINITQKENSSEFTFQCNFQQNISYLNLMIMGPLASANQMEQNDFKYVFGELAHIRHFQSGENRLCVDNREQCNIYESIEKYLLNLLQNLGLKDVQVTFQSDIPKQINKILPKYQNAFILYEHAYNQIYQTMENIKDQIQSNIKLNFVLRDYEILNFSKTMLELPLYKRGSNKKSETVKVLCTLDFNVQKDFQLRTYQALLTFKQLLIEQIVKFLSLNVNETLQSVNASGFDVKISLICDGCEYEILLELYFILRREVNLMGLQNVDKERLLRLAQARALHCSALHNLDSSEAVILKLVKRFLTAHFLSFFCITFDFYKEFHSNLFNSTPFNHFQHKFNNIDIEFFKDNELKQLFNACKEFLDKQIQIKPSAMYAGKMINEELIELLCIFYLQQISFYDKNNIISNFYGCLLFLASIPEYEQKGVVFSVLKAEDLFLDKQNIKNKVKVYTHYDTNAELSLDINVDVFRQNNFPKLVNIATQQSFSAGIFKPSVAHVTHALVLRDDVRFPQFNQKYSIQVAQRTAKQMKQVQEFNDIIVNIQNAQNSQQNNQLKHFQRIDIMKNVLTFLSQFSEFQIFYDYYGGTNIYLQFNEPEIKDLDPTQMKNQQILNDNKIVTSEKYIISQILLHTGVFQAVVVENNRKQWDNVEIVIPKEVERYQGIQYNFDQESSNHETDYDCLSDQNYIGEEEEIEEFEEFEEKDEM